jgi:hypothetical protein
LSKRVKNDIEAYYKLKPFFGKTITKKEFLSILPYFDFRYTQFLAKNSLVKIYDIILVQKSVLQDLTGHADVYWHKITGTNLCPYSMNKIPWYLLPKYGYDKGMIKKDIDPENINKRLKDRDGVIRFLYNIKNRHKEVRQLILPGF